MRSTVRKPLLAKNKDKKTIKVQRYHKVKPVKLIDVLTQNPEARVCVKQSLHGLGDTVMIMPALRELKKKFPDSHLTLGLYRKGKGKSGDIYYELIKNESYINAFVDNSLIIDSDYDCVTDAYAGVLNLEKVGAPPISRIDYAIYKLGLGSSKNKTPNILLTDLETEYAYKMVQQLRTKYKHLVFVHVDSEEERRCWKQHNYINLLTYAQEHRPDVGFLILDFNKKVKEWNSSNYLDVSKTNVRELAALISECDVFLGPDSGPMHIAAAVSTKSYVIFGAVPPSARISYYPKHTAIRLEELSCLGCWYNVCSINIKCMTDLSHLTVFDHVVSNLEV